MARMLPGPWCRSPAKTVSSGRSCRGAGASNAGGVGLEEEARLAFVKVVAVAAADDDGGAVE